MLLGESGVVSGNVEALIGGYISGIGGPNPEYRAWSEDVHTNSSGWRESKKIIILVQVGEKERKSSY